jgi:hypothetical protein
MTVLQRTMLGIAMSLLTFTVSALDKEDFYGTFKLVSNTRKMLDTGEVLNTYGQQPSGYITYGKDGRMLVLIVSDDRPKPASVASITNEQREGLFRSMLAYGGTYSFDGKRIEHQIDISWNEAWTGTTQVRDVMKDGDRLIYTTKPGPNSTDGRMSVTTLIWEKLK